MERIVNLGANGGQETLEERLEDSNREVKDLDAVLEALIGSVLNPQSVKLSSRISCPRFRIETLVIYKLSSRKLTTRNHFISNIEVKV